MKSFKRDKFRHHKCERLPADEREQMKKAFQLNRDDISGVDDIFNRNFSLLDEPRDLVAYNKHWKKKTKGLYLMGLKRWLYIACKRNLEKDPENGAKLFQVLMMILFGIASIGLMVLLYF